MPALSRVACGLAIAGAAALAGIATSTEAALAACDPSYPDFCIPPVWEVGDLDCQHIAGAWFTVYQPDPHYLDGDYDGYGCEWN